MKKTLVLALFFGIAFANTSCNNEKKLNMINNTVKTYFPNAEVIASIKDGFDYDVTLNDYTQIGFDGSLFGSFDWDEVDCKHSNALTTVPTAMVPPHIANYVTNAHNGQSIVKLKKDGKRWEIELSNGFEIEFDKRFNVIDFDD